MMVNDPDRLIHDDNSSTVMILSFWIPIVITIKVELLWLYHRVMSPNDADGIANRVDPDQTADLGLHCLPMHICPKT